MSDLKAMAKQSSHYFLAYALSMVAGLITFPIYTRLFSLSDYGLLGLITTTVFFVMALAKMGIQNSIIRFYEEVKSKKKSIPLHAFYSTLTFGPIAMVAIVACTYATVILCFKNQLHDQRAVVYFLLSAGMMFFQCSNTILRNFLRVEQNTALFNILSVISKYSSLIIGVSLVYYVFKSIAGIYIANTIVECSVFTFMLYRLYKRHRISIAGFNLGFYKESLSYGFPLVGAEFTSIVLNAGARYVILFYMNTTAVGLFSAGYDLSNNVIESLIFPLSFAVTPLYMKIHAQKGKEETGIFLGNCLRYFLMAALPCIFGLNHLAREITVLLASQKFVEAYKVVPFVSTGVLIFGLGNIFNAGLLIAKKSHFITLWTVVAGVINIAINFALIPSMGFVGSAIATLISYSFLFLVLARKSFTYLPFAIDYKRIGSYALFALIMDVVISFLHYDRVLVSIIMKCVTGFLVYAVLLLSFDSIVRDKVTLFLSGKQGIHEVV
jgi:O-antigen/teichoic acid export membrane protein